MSEPQVNPLTGQTPDGRSWRQTEDGVWRECADVDVMFKHAAYAGVGVMLFAVVLWLGAWAAFG